MPFSANKTWNLHGVDGSRWITNWGTPLSGVNPSWPTNLDPRDPALHLQVYKKCFWPELAGNHFLNAKQIVAREDPWSEVICRSTEHVVGVSAEQKRTKHGLLRLADFNPKRVVIWYECGTGKVVQTPFRG